MRLPESRRADGSTVKLVAVALHLRPTLTATLGAALVVREQLGSIVDVLAHLLPDQGHLVYRKVAEVVDHVVVKTAVSLQDYIVQLATPAHAAVGAASCGAVYKTSLEP